MMSTTQVLVDLRSDSDSDEEIDRPVVAHLSWKNQIFPLYEGENLIGREKVCEAALDHPSVSSKHAEIVITGQQVLVRDLRSDNGTFVEMQAGSGDYKKLSVRDNSRTIEHNSKIRLGMVSCTFSLSKDSSTDNMKDTTDSMKDTSNPSNPSSSDTLPQVSPRSNLQFETQSFPPIQGGNSEG
ncbi:FHA domain-containing protein, partial [archaeon]